MHRRWVMAALVVSLVLAGCTRPVSARYESALSQEATQVAGISEPTLTPTAYRAAKKTSTVVAVQTSGGTAANNGSSSVANTGSSAAASGGGYSAVVMAWPGIDTVTLVLVVRSRTGKSAAGAKATVNLSVMAAGSELSGTYTLTADAHGRAEKTIKVPPAQYQTGMTISGFVTLGGVRIPATFSGYSTGG